MKNRIYFVAFIVIIVTIFMATTYVPIRHASIQHILDGGTINGLDDTTWTKYARLEGSDEFSLYVKTYGDSVALDIIQYDTYGNITPVPDSLWTCVKWNTTTLTTDTTFAADSLATGDLVKIPIFPVYGVQQRFLVRGEQDCGHPVTIDMWITHKKG